MCHVTNTRDCRVYFQPVMSAWSLNLEYAYGTVLYLISRMSFTLKLKLKLTLTCPLCPGSVFVSLRCVSPRGAPELELVFL